MFFLVYVLTVIGAFWLFVISDALYNRSPAMHHNNTTGFASSLTVMIIFIFIFGSLFVQEMMGYGKDNAPLANQKKIELESFQKINDNPFVIMRPDKNALYYRLDGTTKKYSLSSIQFKSSDKPYYRVQKYRYPEKHPVHLLNPKPPERTVKTIYISDKNIKTILP